MRLHRCPRRWLSGWLTVMLLLTQWIPAANACPMLAWASSGAAAVSMPGCDGHMPGAKDPEQPQLCQVHCSQDAQTVRSAPGADLPPAPAVLQARRWCFRLVSSNGQVQLAPGMSLACSGQFE